MERAYGLWLMAKARHRYSMTQPTPPPTRLRDAIREAIHGVHSHDYTSGPLGRSVILLAVPMVLETVMESVFAVVDVFFVSRLGPEAIAAVGLTESMLTLVYTVSIGLGIGLTALVARRIGQKDPDGAARAAVQGIVLGLLAAAGVAAIGIGFGPRLLGLMGASPAVIALGSGYTRVMLGGSATVLLLFMINAIFRGAGDASVAMRSLWLANWVNIVLGPCLIFGLGPFPALGVRGAAIGTTIGRGTGVLYQLYRLSRARDRIAIERRHLVLDPGVMASVLRLSGTGTFQVLIGTSSYIGVIRILSTFGSAAVAGYTIAIRLVMFALLPSWGLSNSAATMVGQNLGAGKPDRAEQAVWLTSRYNMVFLGSVSLLFIGLAVPIVHLFTRDAATAPVAVMTLRVISLGFLFYAWGMVLQQSFNGAGDTWTPTWLNILCFWCLELPLAWLLARPLGLGPLGVSVAIAVAFSTMAVASTIMFRRGAWKTKRV
jgi:MATE family, multidrug efflux pump